MKWNCERKNICENERYIKSWAFTKWQMARAAGKGEETPSSIYVYIYIYVKAIYTHTHIYEYKCICMCTRKLKGSKIKEQRDERNYLIIIHIFNYINLLIFLLCLLNLEIIICKQIKKLTIDKITNSKNFLFVLFNIISHFFFLFYLFSTGINNLKLWQKDIKISLAI